MRVEGLMDKAGGGSRSSTVACWISISIIPRG